MLCVSVSRMGQTCSLVLFRVTVALGANPVDIWMCFIRGQYSHSVSRHKWDPCAFQHKRDMAQDSVESSAVQSLGHWVKSQVVSHYFKLPVG